MQLSPTLNWIKHRHAPPSPHPHRQGPASTWVVTKVNPDTVEHLILLVSGLCWKQNELILLLPASVKLKIITIWNYQTQLNHLYLVKMTTICFQFIQLLFNSALLTFKCFKLTCPDLTFTQAKLVLVASIKRWWFVYTVLGFICFILFFTNCVTAWTDCADGPFFSGSVFVMTLTEAAAISQDLHKASAAKGKLIGQTLWQGQICSDCGNLQTELSHFKRWGHGLWLADGQSQFNYILRKHSEKDIKLNMLQTSKRKCFINIR